MSTHIDVSKKDGELNKDTMANQLIKPLWKTKQNGEQNKLDDAMRYSRAKNRKRTK